MPAESQTVQIKLEAAELSQDEAVKGGKSAELTKGDNSGDAQVDAAAAVVVGSKCETSDAAEAVDVNGKTVSVDVSGNVDGKISVDGKTSVDAADKSADEVSSTSAFASNGNSQVKIIAFFLNLLFIYYKFTSKPTVIC